MFFFSFSEKWIFYVIFPTLSSSKKVFDLMAMFTANKSTEAGMFFTHHPTRKWVGNWWRRRRTWSPSQSPRGPKTPPSTPRSAGQSPRDSCPSSSSPRTDPSPAGPAWSARPPHSPFPSPSSPVCAISRRTRATAGPDWPWQCSACCCPHPYHKPLKKIKKRSNVTIKQLFRNKKGKKNITNKNTFYFCKNINFWKKIKVQKNIFAKKCKKIYFEKNLRGIRRTEH